MKKRTIIVADTLGFCFGVRRALEKVEKALDAGASGAGGRVLTYGPLIHNRLVLEELASRGVETADTPEAVRPGDRVVIRAHGIPGGEKERLLERGADIVDGTCPRVLKSERLVEEYSGKGYRIVIAGDRMHGEVAAVSSHGTDVLVMESAAEAEAFTPEQPLLFLSQTTFSPVRFEEMSEVLRNKCETAGVAYRRFNTVCPATGARQKALVALCGDVDAVVVVGGRNSSNTKRLYESAKERLNDVWHIEEASEVNAEMGKFSRIGVTAGASTPDSIINEVIAALEAL